MTVEEDCRKGVVELARFLAPAVFVEPELLRAMRVKVFPILDVGAEADLWFGPLVRSHGVNGIRLQTPILEELRNQLAERWLGAPRSERERFSHAQRVMDWVHRDLSPALALEERVNWLAISGDRAGIEAELDKVLAAVVKSGRPGLLRWWAGAWDRAPELVRETRAAWLLRQAAVPKFGTLRLRPAKPPVTLQGIDLTAVLKDVPDVRLGVRRDGPVLEIGEVEGKGAAAILVPNTDPRLVDISWEEESGEVRESLAVPVGEIAARAVGRGLVKLRTAKGRLYKLVEATTPETTAGTEITDKETDKDLLRLIKQAAKEDTTSLDLSNRQLVALPPEIGQLQNLQSLDLRGNRLTALPPEIGQLQDLQRLDLSDNPLPEPYAELIRRGTAAVLSYQRSLAKESMPAQYEAKLILVGEGNVGKTSLVTALAAAPAEREKVFEEYRATTHGINLGAVKLDHPSGDEAKRITLYTWDFGGQQVYRITHQFFFSKRSLYLLVWWPREGQEASGVKGQLNRIRLRVPDARVILVSTHADERRQPEIDYGELERAFPVMLVGRHAVDSKSGTGIDELLATIAVEAAQLPQMGEKMNRRWIETRDEVLARQEPQIARYDFHAVAQRYGLDETEIETLLDLLHDLGRVVYYGDDEGLRDSVVIKPEWLTKVIGYVLEDKAAREAKGELQHSRLRDIWYDHNEPTFERYEPSCHPFFLRLMEKFDISYRFPGGQASLVVELVPYERPELPWDAESKMPKNWRELAVVCSMEDEAPGIVAWLTVRNHKYVWEKVHWRTGVFVSHRGQEGLIELLNPTELRLTVRGRSPEYLLGLLRDSLTTLIRQRWEGLTIELLVPCDGTKKNGGPCDYRFGLEDLQSLRDEGIKDQRCIRCRKVQDVDRLLTGLEAPTTPVDERLDRIFEHVTAIASGTGRHEEKLDEHRNESAEQMRVLRKALGAEKRESPSLFTIVPLGGGPLRNKYEMTLWCEHPGDEHPCENGEYTFKRPKAWLAQAAPYLSIVGKSLRVVVALAGLPGAGQLIDEATSKQLGAMEKLTKELVPDRVPGGEAAEDGSGLTRAQGEAFRQFQSLPFELDKSRKWAGMRRFLTPAGDYLWICPKHHREYDPGLPVLPGCQAIGF